MNKLFLIPIFCFLLVTGSTHAMVEINVAGAYSIPSGDAVTSLDAVGTILGGTVTKGGIGATGSVLFGSSTFRLGADVGYLPLMKLTIDPISVNVNLLPILAAFKWQTGAFYLTGGAGITKLSVSASGMDSTMADGTDMTGMFGAGLSFGQKVGIDLGAKYYYISDTTALSCIVPFGGIHFFL